MGYISKANTNQLDKTSCLSTNIRPIIESINPIKYAPPSPIKIFPSGKLSKKNPAIDAKNNKVVVPKPIAIKNNVLVEELIGEPAPQLKDSHPDDPKKFLKLIIDQIKLLYKGGLIHGDLSAFNILNHNEKPYLIDFSQATLIKTPNSEELLERDLKNILQFFKKLHVEEDLNELMKKIKK